MNKFWVTAADSMASHSVTLADGDRWGGPEADSVVWPERAASEITGKALGHQHGHDQATRKGLRSRAGTRE